MADRDTIPLDAENRDVVHVVLVEPDLLRGKVSLRPLSQSPPLHDQVRLLQLDELSHDVAVENRELAALLGAVELAWWPTRKGSKASGVGKGGEELFGSRAEFVVGSDGGGVHVDFSSGRGGRGLGWRGSGRVALREVSRRCEARRWVGASRVLESFAMLSNQGRAEFGEFSTKLGDNLGANEVLDRLLRRLVIENVDVKLKN